MPVIADGGWAELWSQDMYRHHHGELLAAPTVDVKMPHLNSDDIAVEDLPSVPIRPR
jgi:hypothetical protein